jgi:hypothetical protein
VAEPGTPLTLLPAARLDKIGNGFVLLGYDGSARLVRWAPVDPRGTVGAEQSAVVPAAVAGPWFAAAGRASPGDTILIAYGTASNAPGMIDVQILAAPAAGGTPVAAGVLATIPDPTGLASGIEPALVTMASGGLGMHAALAWTRPAQGQVPGEVDVQSLGGDGRALGPPLVQTSSSTAPQITCLSFFSGKNDLTVGYLTQSSTSDPQPSWIALELRDDGSLDGSVTFRLGTANPTCPLSAATSDGYVTVWQNEIGSWIAVYDRASNNVTSKLFAGAVTFGGSDAQPPLAGVGPVAGGDFAVVLAQTGAAEAWRVASTGTVAPESVVFPSAVGQMGEISTVSLAGALYSTYADYSSSASVGKDGQRFFVKVTCF